MNLKHCLSLLTGILLFTSAQSQYYVQYFDGADTTEWNSLFIEFDDDSTNIWQIGPPQKLIFNEAATVPNVIITDTINPYPINKTSSFWFEIPDDFGFWGILAVQWKQKLDMDPNGDGGKIEVSSDGGENWENIFENPFVYNLFGHDWENVMPLPNDEAVFSGLDTNWRDLWLCFDLSWMSTLEYPIRVKYTFISDSVDTAHEGWMMDNFLAHITIVHTVEEKERNEYLTVFPNPATDRIQIEASKITDYHIIEHMTLHNAAGQLIEQWTNIPTKFFIDTRSYKSGIYHLKIQTNLKSETKQVVIQR